MKHILKKQMLWALLLVMTSQAVVTFWINFPKTE